MSGYFGVLIETLLSGVPVAITGYLAVLVMNQRLSYFHSVRYLFALSYILFGAIVLSDFGFINTVDPLLASLLLKIAITAVVGASALLSVAATVLSLQARRRESGYHDIIRKPPVSLVFSLAVGATTLVLLWGFFNFDFTLGTNLISGNPVLIPRFEAIHLITFGLVLAGFVWNQTKLLSREIDAFQPAALSSVMKNTSVLWILMATILFTFNGAIRATGISIIEIGHLLDSLVLGYLAYVYTRPTALLEFFASDSPLALQLKRKQYSKLLDIDLNHGTKSLIETDSVSDYPELVQHVLGSDDRSVICLTYQGSPLLAESPNKALKTIELSLSAEGIEVSREGRVKAPLSKKSIYELLNWATEANPNGLLAIDGLSHFINLIGVDEVYSIVSYVSELCGKQGIRFLMILNYQAHSQEVVALFEGLADHVIRMRRNRLDQLKPIDRIRRAAPLT